MQCGGVVIECSCALCRVGKTGAIQLFGEHIQEEHCLLANNSGTVTIEALNDSQTFVNGKQVTEVLELRTGDRIILGDNHVLKFRHPEQSECVCVCVVVVVVTACVCMYLIFAFSIASSAAYEPKPKALAKIGAQTSGFKEGWVQFEESYSCVLCVGLIKSSMSPLPTMYTSRFGIGTCPIPVQLPLSQPSWFPHFHTSLVLCRPDGAEQCRMVPCAP